MVTILREKQAKVRIETSIPEGNHLGTHSAETPKFARLHNERLIDHTILEKQEISVMKLFEKKCTLCEGRKVIAAGAWTTIYEAHDCPHCAGTGVEPGSGITVSGDLLLALFALVLLIVVVVIALSTPVPLHSPSPDENPFMYFSPWL